ncbi:MAG: PQQ-binding-like beta-propeller repeat protein [Deltaproteobacteria bacterium]|nr:PQQ-binding-like beta-propeller repeat protein [Deltaproteobacteria bacterium]
MVLAVMAIATSSASAATIHGLVYADENGDGKPSAGEPGIGHAVVAFDVRTFVETDASGQFDLQIPDDEQGLVWVRVPDGFAPGPVWKKWDGKHDVDLGLARTAPIHGPFSFVVAADTHVWGPEEYFGAEDLARAAASATALDPAPAFFTILGDITQGGTAPELALIDRALDGLGVPYIPVPGNHDWYDGGKAWLEHYGPDNYSFDVGGVHFIVWNMVMDEASLDSFLDGELARVPRAMPVVTLTHAPPPDALLRVLRKHGVAYVLTGHLHTNRVVDHDGMIELNTEPFLMGGLDFTPAGYRVFTVDNGKLASYHRTTVDAPFVQLVAPAPGQCVRGGDLIAAAELDASASVVTARVDCATAVSMRWAGGWSWRAPLAELSPGAHTVTIEATNATGAHAATTSTVQICEPAGAPGASSDWNQLGGNAQHTGAREHVLAPPLVTRWTQTVGGHVITAPPVIANGSVFVAVTDLADGGAGGIVAVDLATGATRWRVVTAGPVRGGVAAAGDTVSAVEIDGTVLGLDAATGRERWRYALSTGVRHEAGAAFASVSTDGGDFLVGHQRHLAALAHGTPQWTAEPVPTGVDSQSAAAIAIGGGLAIGTFNRWEGGVIAFDRATGRQVWHYDSDTTIGINASPVIGGDQVFVATAADRVLALDLTGQLRWQVDLDPTGFNWGNATIGTPAYAHGILVVPTLYKDLVALDATTGAELWRHAGAPGPLRDTHYRGAGQPGYAASPVITGDIVWAVDTSGLLVALDVLTGDTLWSTTLGVPVLAGLATTGDYLVAASYDGTVRALVPGTPRLGAAASCTQAPPAGCCANGSSPNIVIGLGGLCFGGVVLRRRRAR